MPRGKYDRKESRIHRLEAELAKVTEAKKSLSQELAQTNVELKAARKIADVVERIPAVSSVMPTEKFVILRDNLKILSESRRLLVDSDQVGQEVLGELDVEITAHLKMLGALRQETFRVVGGTKPGDVKLPETELGMSTEFKSVKSAVG